MERNDLEMIVRSERENVGQIARPEPLPSRFRRHRRDLPPGRQEVERLPTGPESSLGRDGDVEPEGSKS